MTTHRARLSRRTLFAAPLLLARPALAQAWPARPVRVIVPFGPGGPTDVMARTVAHGLTAALGQPFLVENRPGAGGNVGVVAVARSAPDGYTLLVSSSGFVVNTSLFRNPGYDALRDFAPIMELGASPNAFLATNASSIRTVPDLVAKARGTPDGMPCANPGTGSTPHLTSELLRIRTGVTFIPTAECFDRWYSSLLTLMRRVQTSGLLGSPDRRRAAFAASARVKASCRRYHSARAQFRAGGGAGGGRRDDRDRRHRARLEPCADQGRAGARAGADGHAALVRPAGRSHHGPGRLP